MVAIKFEFTKFEVDYLIENAGFDDDEIDVFKLRLRGKSIVAVAQTLNLSTRTVDRKIKSIKRKIMRVI